MMNVNAKEFFPLNVILENEMFDKLENDFVKNNDWLFNYEFQDSEKVKNVDLGKYYYGIKDDKEQQVLKKNKFEKKLETVREEITYADILRNK
jgi:hypothetical protein